MGDDDGSKWKLRYYRKVVYDVLYDILSAKRQATIVGRL